MTCARMDHARMDGRRRLDLALAAAAESEPEAARVAAAALDDLLGPGADSRDGGEPADTWRGSVLCRDGYPVELGFVPGAPGIRYTVELPPAGDGDRWDRTLDAAGRLGATVPPALETALLDPVRRVQTGTREPLRYGAWLSGRHTADGTGLKLYAEVPPGSAPLWRPWERTLLDRPAPLPTRRPTLRMVGVDLSARDLSSQNRAPGRIELYYDLSSLHPSEVARLAERVGLEGRAPEILDLLREAVCLPLGHELPARCDWGFSYALEAEPPRRPLAFTLYTFANALFGGDGKIRRALLALGERRGWDLSLYERVSEPLAARRGFVTCHGVFGVTVTAAPAAPAVGTWGLAPPPLRREDPAAKTPLGGDRRHPQKMAAAGGRR